MQRKVRTFVAVEVSPEVSAHAAQLILKLSTSLARVRWADPHQMHLTLKFLGDVDLLDIPEVCRAVAEAAKDFAPFDVEVCGAGAFPNAERPRTVWVGIGRGLEELVKLQSAIESRLEQLGYRREARRFHPHLTIGRVRDGDAELKQLGRLLAEQEGFACGLVDVAEVMVFSSELGRDGPTYEPLSVAVLRGR